MDLDTAVGEVFNIGRVEEIAIRDLAQRVVEFTGSDSTIEYVPYEVAYDEDFEDMQRRVPSIKKIGEAIGWRPEKSLDDILTSIIEHESSLARDSSGSAGP